MSFLKNALTPPPYDIASCARKRITTICASVLASVSIAGGIYAIHTAPDAAAASLIETNIHIQNSTNSVPAQEIILDRPLDYYAIDQITTTGNLTYVKNTSSANTWEHKYQIYENSTVSASGLRSVSGTATLRFNDQGTDKNGNRIDVIVTLSNIQMKIHGGTTYNKPCYCELTTWGIDAGAGSAGTNSGKSISAEMTYSIKFVKKGTSTLATGTFISGVNGLNVNWGGDYYPETFIFGSNCGTIAYVRKAAERRLDISSNNTVFASKNPTITPTDDYKMGLVYVGGASHSIKWRGSNCSTNLFRPYNPYTITAKAETGGTITNAGAKTVGWKNEPSYTVTASTNYKIKSLVVDSTAVSVPANSKTYTYKFSPLYANHTITATFEKISTTLSYNKNLASATGTTASQTAYAGTSVAARQNGFVAEGKRFREWNTKPDGTGTRYAVGATVPLGESPITLYAQWDDIYNTITETHTQGGTVSPTGATSVIYKGELLYNIVPDEGYLIQEVLVDGNKIDISPAADGSAIYKFAGVVANHTIHISFKHVPLTVRWIDALTGEEVAVSSVEMGDDAVIPDIPPHSGHRFTHLSGGDWHCITEDRIIYINYSPYAYDFPQDSSARYNGFTFAYEGK